LAPGDYGAAWHLSTGSLEAPYSGSWASLVAFLFMGFMGVFWDFFFFISFSFFVYNLRANITIKIT
jgi:hypothetical protein